MGLIVRKPGQWSTIQDAGRTGWQRYGVPVAGPMDRASHAAANLLVGNGMTEAAVELTLAGGEFEAAADLRIAVCGADLAPQADGVPLPMWRPVDVPAGTILAFGGATVGRCAYLAAAGGIRVPEWLGSRSTARGVFPGMAGRPLQPGDVLPVGGMDSSGIASEPAAASSHSSGKNIEFPRWFLGPDWRFSKPDETGERTVRALRGREWDRFDERTRLLIEAGEWRCVVHPLSDRMGYRLEAPVPPQAELGRMLSEAVAPGTLQVPPDGRPIALMADRQTTGGYPRLLQVIAADRDILAQARPGDVVRFLPVSLETAVTAWLERQDRLNWLRARLAWNSPRYDKSEK